METWKGNCVKLWKWILNCSHWRPQDAGDTRTKVYLLRRQGVEPVQETEVCCSQESWKSGLIFDVRHDATEFGAYPEGYQYWFGLVFPHYTWIHSFILERLCIFCAIVYCNSVICFLILQGYTIKWLPWVSEGTLSFRTTLHCGRSWI